MNNEFNSINLILVVNCVAVADIVFVMDSSGSIRWKNPVDQSYDNYQLMKDFVIDIINSFEFGPDKVRYVFLFVHKYFVWWNKFITH